MAVMNNQLLEESGDIEYQVKLFSENLMSSKMEDEKVDLERQHQKAL